MTLKRVGGRERPRLWPWPAVNSDTMDKAGDLGVWQGKGMTWGLIEFNVKLNCPISHWDDKNGLLPRCSSAEMTLGQGSCQE